MTLPTMPASGKAACLLASVLFLAAPYAAADNVDCSVTMDQQAEFLEYDPFDPQPTTTVAQAIVTCTTNKKDNGQNPTITVYYTASVGNGPSAAQRAMKSPSGALLPYNLYRDSGYNTVISNTTSVAQSFTAPGSKEVPMVYTHNIYARILPGEDAEVGDYTDNLVYTVYF
ncbi:Csu type fimbrial protein [Massilia glaciei]|nr:spore coat protein U domain-containing protein [Massilia glaciei]